jgi:serine/threonine protein kinase
MIERSCLTEEELLALATGSQVDADAQAHLKDCIECRDRVRQKEAEPAESPRHEPTVSWHDGQTPPTAGAEPAGGPSSSQPETIGKYRVLSLLAVAGQAEVYRAFHPNLRKDVAIKLMRRRSGLIDRETRESMIRDGELLAQLRHPHILPVYDLDLYDDRPYLVLEYAAGRDLRQYAQDERLTPRRIAALVAKQARAVGYAHQMGVIHCDVKPANIVIDEDDQPKLIDFGMARLRNVWTEGAEDREAAGGTPGFMAPEQARQIFDRTQEVDRHSDIFALGGVLYFLLTGKQVFQGGSPAETLERASRCEFDQDALNAARAPRRLKKICLRALAAAPSDRYDKVEDLAADLEAFVRRPKRLRFAGLLFGAVMLLIAVVTAPWWLPTGSRPPESTKTGQSKTIPPGDNLHQLSSTGLVPDAPDSLEIEVWRGDQHFTTLSQAVPLRSNDEVRVRGRVARDMHVALFWLDTEGKTHELALEVTEEQSALRFVYPRQEWAGQGRATFTGLAGPPGTELIFFCARRDGEIRDTDVAGLRELLGGVPWPELPADEGLLLRPQGVEPLLRLRGPGPLTDRPERAARDRAEKLRRQLAERFDLFQGFVFPYVE